MTITLTEDFQKGTVTDAVDMVWYSDHVGVYITHNPIIGTPLPNGITPAEYAEYVIEMNMAKGTMDERPEIYTEDGLTYFTYA